MKMFLCTANDWYEMWTNWSPVFGRGLLSNFSSILISDFSFYTTKNKIKAKGAEKGEIARGRTSKKTKILRCDKDEKSLFHFTNRFNVSVRVCRFHEFMKNYSAPFTVLRCYTCQIVPDVRCSMFSEWETRQRAESYSVKASVNRLCEGWHWAWAGARVNVKLM